MVLCGSFAGPLRSFAVLCGSFAVFSHTDPRSLAVAMRPFATSTAAAAADADDNDDDCCGSNLLYCFHCFNADDSNVVNTCKLVPVSCFVEALAHD